VSSIEKLDVGDNFIRQPQSLIIYGSWDQLYFYKRIYTLFKPIHLICALENGKNKTASRNIKRAKKWYTTYYNKKQIKGKDRRSTRNSQYSEWIPKKNHP